MRVGTTSKKADPSRCMAVGCPKLGIYRTPGATNQRGYCFTHKHFAVPPPAPVESGVEYLARQFEALEARGDAWSAEVDDENA